MGWTVSEYVLGNEDLLALILAHTELLPAWYVAVSGVNKTWYAVCRRDERLLIKCAKARPYLTKRYLVGLFALTSREANRLPRETCIRRDGGVMYKYEMTVVDGLLVMLGGMEGWRSRLERRATYEKNVAQTFGHDWRKWWERHPLPKMFI